MWMLIVLAIGFGASRPAALEQVGHFSTEEECLEAGSKIDVVLTQRYIDISTVCVEVSNPG